MYVDRGTDENGETVFSIHNLKAAEMIALNNVLTKESWTRGYGHMISIKIKQAINNFNHELYNKSNTPQRNQ